MKLSKYVHFYQSLHHYYNYYSQSFIVKIDIQLHKSFWFMQNVYISISNSEGMKNLMHLPWL